MRNAWRTRNRSIRLRLRLDYLPHQRLMNDDTPTSNKDPVRRQPPVTLALAVFLASIVGFMAVVTGLFALLRFLGGWR